MRSKSLVNVVNLVKELSAGRLFYGSILAESYWRESADGFIIESTPATSEILNAWFYPYIPTINAGRVYINRLFVDIRLEELTAAGGVHIERLTLKPDLNTPPPSADFINRELQANFREHWSAND